MGAAALVTALAVWALLARSPLPVSPEVGRSWQDITLPPIPPSPAERQLRRPLYRYSVVPGGVYSRQELETAIETDPVVAAHYRGFDVSRARVVRVEAPRQVHVSYRMNGRVYWTGEKTWLRPGEALLSDGVQVVRSRCGNKVSEVPVDPPTPSEPPIELLDEPVPDPPAGILPLQAYNLMFTAVPEIAPRPMPEPLDPLPSVPLLVLPTPPVLVTEVVDPPTPPPAGPVPEPTTWLLVGTGATVAYIRARWRRRSA